MLFRSGGGGEGGGEGGGGEGGGRGGGGEGGGGEGNAQPVATSATTTSDMRYFCTKPFMVTLPVFFFSSAAEVGKNRIGKILDKSNHEACRRPTPAVWIARTLSYTCTPTGTQDLYKGMQTPSPLAVDYLQSWRDTDGDARH